MNLSLFRDGSHVLLSSLPDGVICASGGGAKNGPVVTLGIDAATDAIIVLAGSADANPDVAWDISAHTCIASADSASQANVYVVLNSSEGIENKIATFSVSRGSVEPRGEVWDAPMNVLAASCSPDGGKMLVIRYGDGVGAE
jgi:hypothetical protein